MALQEIIMNKFIISGGIPLKGEVSVSGAKNVALKVLLAALLTDEEVTIENIPLITDFYLMVELIKGLGVEVKIFKDKHKIVMKNKGLKEFKIPLETGARLRTSSMIIAPLLARFGKAQIPNPGGCRIGARPIGRHIEGLKKMGVEIKYRPEDGYFHAEAKKLSGTTYKFFKNTHTGTETLILAAVLADGETVLENAAQEPEVDDLIRLLNLMGAKIRRASPRKIVVKGIRKLYGVRFKIMPDRNEVVTFAIAALATRGDLLIHGTQRENLKAFLEKIDEAGGGWEPVDQETTRFFLQGELRSTDIVTAPHPGFMTDWQAPWAVLMTQVKDTSVIHETVFENRLLYAKELKKLGAKIEFFNPDVRDPEKFYNFNWEDNDPSYYHAIRIFGSTPLHNAFLEVSDLRAGATLVLAALVASGKSFIYGMHHIDRGYEKIEERLKKLGAKIKRA